MTNLSPSLQKTCHFFTNRMIPTTGTVLERSYRKLRFINNYLNLANRKYCDIEKANESETKFNLSIPIDEDIRRKITL